MGLIPSNILHGVLVKYGQLKIGVNGADIFIRLSYGTRL